MRKVRLVSDSALHHAGAELHVAPTDAVAAHALDSVSRAHAAALIADGYAVAVDEPVVAPVPEPEPAFTVRRTEWKPVLPPSRKPAVAYLRQHRGQTQPSTHVGGPDQ